MDYIEFNHDINWEKFDDTFRKAPFKIIFSTLFSPSNFDKYFEKNFEKFYKSNKIEEIQMRNLFLKQKAKNIINSNISPNHNYSKNNYLYNINKIRIFGKFLKNKSLVKNIIKTFCNCLIIIQIIILKI